MLLDQTRLPGERVERSCRTVAELVDAIQVLAIRGAPALGVAGAMGIALAARDGARAPGRHAPVPGGAGRAAGGRPADRRQPRVGRRRGAGRARPRRRATRRRRAAASRPGRGGSTDEEVARCRAMGAHGAALFADGAAPDDAVQHRRPRDRRLRHRARRRARARRARRRPARVGARDPAAAAGRAADGLRAGRGRHPPHPRHRQRDRRDPAGGRASPGIVVGADRIAANGDTANKIGTYNLAVLARHHGVPFYVVAPTSTIDPGHAVGRRDPDRAALRRTR